MSETPAWDEEHASHVTPPSLLHFAQCSTHQFAHDAPGAVALVIAAVAHSRDTKTVPQKQVTVQLMRALVARAGNSPT
jgi:hypothetical protein